MRQGLHDKQAKTVVAKVALAGQLSGQLEGPVQLDGAFFMPSSD